MIILKSFSIKSEYIKVHRLRSIKKIISHKQFYPIKGKKKYMFEFAFRCCFSSRTESSDSVRTLIFLHSVSESMYGRINSKHAYMKITIFIEVTNTYNLQGPLLKLHMIWRHLEQDSQVLFFHCKSTCSHRKAGKKWCTRGIPRECSVENKRDNRYRTVPREFFLSVLQVQSSVSPFRMKRALRFAGRLAKKN